VSPLQLCEQVLAVLRRGFAVFGCPSAIRGGLHALGGGLVAQLRESYKSSGSSRVGTAQVLPHPPHLAVVLLGDSITLGRHAVAFSGNLVALLGLPVTLEGDLGPDQGRSMTVEGGLDAFGAGELMAPLHLLITRGV
jgi:hypothetical protein